MITSTLFAYSEISTSNEWIESEKLSYVCSIVAGIQNTAEFFTEKKDFEFIERKLINISADPFINLIFIADPDGKILVSSKRKFIGKGYHKVLKEELPNLYQLVNRVIGNYTGKTGIYCDIVDEGRHIIGISPILFSTNKNTLRPDRIGFVFLDYDLQKIKEMYRLEIILKLASEFGILFVLLTIIYITFNKMIAERIETIVKAVQQIVKGDFDVRVNLQGRDEFALVADAINQLIEKLNRYITIDYLTGILNRFGLERQIEKALKQNNEKWNVFIFIDIDNFKDINDTFGHDFGDELLKAFSSKLKKRTGDKIVGRLGGDEFIVFFQTDKKPNINRFMADFMKSVSGSIQVRNQIIEVDITAGVTVKKDRNATFYELLKESDIALYYGKKKGKKIFVLFNDEIRLKEERRIKLTEILKKSVENRDFYLVYQPIVELKTGRIVSAEALLRMKNKNLGEVSPAEFIPILEDTGLIKEIGYWVIEQVCQDLKYWKENGVDDLSISVNVDIQQLLDRRFVGKVNEILTRFNISPEKLKIEITESEAMKFPERVISVLFSLKKSGIEISIDDFGTGYSSLSYLKIMPVSYIKIDRSFIKNIPRKREDNLLVMSIISLSKSLGYKAIAEGVEEELQALYLKEIGCDYIQGFIFSPPVNRDKLLQMKKEDRRLQA
ncbi:MAG: EAL domain-containing protein [Aquificae bacterium]|nr:EAL domain-containing protein [Aquificota bacterium]